MGLVRLAVERPRHDSVALVGEPVRFEGRVDPADVPPSGLTYRWYSSVPKPGPIDLGDPKDPARAALNTTSTLAFSAPLDRGSNAISLTAKDVAGDDKASLEAVRFAGMAGGREQPAPCVVHVLHADPLLPAERLVSRAAGAFAAAPPVWPALGQAGDELRYSWIFEPLGLPDGRVRVPVAPSTQELEYLAASSPLGPPPRVRVGLPPTLSLQSPRYQLTLWLTCGGASVSTSTDVTIIG